jgi:threonine dehydratase
MSWHDEKAVAGELVSLAEVKDARERLEGVAVRTPLEPSRALSDRLGGAALVKCENLQRTGSFKIRGAYNRVSRLTAAEREAGVVAASAGNHAQGVALAASLAGIDSVVFMPEAAALPKVDATKRYGAEVRLVGKDFGAAAAAALEHARASGSVFVHPFDHRHIIAGQGTVGSEIVEQADDTGTVVVPMGGGGLISGVAVALRALTGSVRIVGVQAEGASSFRPSLATGEVVTLEHMSTIADGIAANSPAELTLAHVAALVDEVVSVSDEAIAEALVFAAERMKMVLEPAGAAGLAAALESACEMVPPIVVVLSGGNVDPLLLLRVIRFGLSAAGRYFAFHTRLADRPGELHRLTGCIADMGANIVGIEHRREGVSIDLGDVDVTLQLETRGTAHIEELTQRLGDLGFAVLPLH